MVNTAPKTSHIDGLTEEENRDLRGVLNPSDNTDPNSRLGDKSALQIQANHFQEPLDKVMEQKKTDKRHTKAL